MKIEFETDLIYTEIFYKINGQEHVFTKNFTSGQLRLIKEVGYVNIDGYRYQVSEIVLACHSDNNNFIAIIETKVIKK